MKSLKKRPVPGYHRAQVFGFGGPGNLLPRVKVNVSSCGCTPYVAATTWAAVWSWSDHGCTKVGPVDSSGPCSCGVAKELIAGEGALRFTLALPSSRSPEPRDTQTFASSGAAPEKLPWQGSPSPKAQTWLPVLQGAVWSAKCRQN